MKKIIKNLIILFTIVQSMNAFAQQQVMFTQYMFNGLAINPAYAGSQETLSATGLMREQWTGLDGAPSTQTLSVHSPVKDQKMGLGFMLLHDKIGVTSQTGAYFSYAYKIAFLNGGKLSMGLQGGFTNYNSKFSKVSVTDPTFSGGDISEWLPNAGAGLFYSTERFYAGASVPQLIQTTFDHTNKDSDSKLMRHYFISAGYVLDLNESLKLKPNVLAKYVKGAPLEIDLNANLLIKELVWVGFSWRSFDSIDAILQLQVNQRLQIGYAYDFATTSDIRKVNSGSHELMINYRLPVFRDRIVTPRYF
jgi:type IX secretion system PorP/SprF family membrane protein